MKQQINAMQIISKAGKVSRVRAIGITPRSIGREDQAFVWNDTPISRSPSGSLFNRPNSIKRNTKIIHHIPTNVGQDRLFAKQETCARDAMTKWKRVDCYGRIFVNKTIPVWMSVKNDLKFEATTECRELHTQDRLQSLGSIYMQIGRTSQHGER